MFIGFPTCSFKCCKEGNFPVEVCQNCSLAKANGVDVSPEHIVDRFLSNPITSAIVIGGMEPFDSVQDLITLVHPYNFDSISYTTTSAYIFSCIYAVSMTFVLAKTDNENGKLFSSSNILLLIWCIASLVFYVYFITGNITWDWDSNYWWYRMEGKEGNIYVAMGLASIAMIWALLKKRAKTVLYKSPLLLVIIAMSIDFLRTIYFFAFCSEWEPGNFCEDYISVFDNIRNVLMIISCFMIYRNAKKQFD